MSVRDRVDGFCARYGLTVPILAAPMAGACPPELSIAVAEAGGMGAARRRAGRARADRRVDAAVPGRHRRPRPAQHLDPRPPRRRSRRRRARVAARPVPRPARHRRAPSRRPAPDFAAQCTAMLDARPTVVSSIMGRFDRDYVRRLPTPASPGSPSRPRSTTRSPRRTPAPTPSSRRGWRPAGTAAPGTRPPPRPPTSACSRWSRGWPTVSTCPSSPPAASPTAAAWRPR